MYEQPARVTARCRFGGRKFSATGTCGPPIVPQDLLNQYPAEAAAAFESGMFVEATMEELTAEIQGDLSSQAAALADLIPVDDFLTMEWGTPRISLRASRILPS